MGTWRKMFGPSKQEIWKQLSTEVQGRFVEGGLWKGDKVQATHGEWTVTLDTFAVSTGKAVIVFTRMRAPYVNPDGFRFTVYPRGMFSELAKKLGMQDVEIGVPPFDTNFIVKGTDASKLRALFSDACAHCWTRTARRSRRVDRRFRSKCWVFRTFPRRDPK